MNSRFGRRTTNTVRIRSASAESERPPDSSSPAFETRDQSRTAQELTEAWDVDVLRRKLIRPGLKPLSADELEFLVSRFPDVMPQVYVRPDTILFGMANRQGYLMQVARQDLGFPRRRADSNRFCAREN
jgi:hypothetical protein